MSISERINSDELNIHQFQEAPKEKPELPFDVERDISSKIQEEMFETLKITSDHRVASNIVILFPEAKQLITKTDEELWNMGMVVSKTDVDLIYGVSWLKIIRPNFEPLPTQVDLRKLIKRGSDILRNNRSLGVLGKLTDTLSMIERLKIIDPTAPVELSEAEIGELNTSLTSERIDGNFGTAINASKFKLLNPSYNPKLSPEIWERLLQKLAFFETRKSVFYTVLAVAMKILAAHKVEVTSPGVIDIQMHSPQDVNTSTPPMPETRKF